MRYVPTYTFSTNFARPIINIIYRLDIGKYQVYFCVRPQGLSERMIIFKDTATILNPAVLVLEGLLWNIDVPKIEKLLLLK